MAAAGSTYELLEWLAGPDSNMTDARAVHDFNARIQLDAGNWRGGARPRSESAGVVSAVVPTILHLAADNVADCATAETANNRTG